MARLSDDSPDALAMRGHTAVYTAREWAAPTRNHLKWACNTVSVVRVRRLRTDSRAIGRCGPHSKRSAPRMFGSNVSITSLSNSISSSNGYLHVFQLQFVIVRIGFNRDQRREGHQRQLVSRLQAESRPPRLQASLGASLRAESNQQASAHPRPRRH